MTQASQKLEAPVVSPTTGALLPGFLPDGARVGAIGREVEQLSHEEVHLYTKELTNKLAWAVGSFYKVPYSGKRTIINKYVFRCARAILRDHGYPI